MLVRDDFIPRRPVSRATKLEVVKAAVLSADLKRSIFDRFFYHECSVRRIARAYGRAESEVEDALRAAVGEDRQNHARREFVRGRLSMMPQPPVTLRRAA